MADDNVTTENQEKHWTEGRESFTPEMKTAFAKYKSEDDALKGAFEAQKQVGRPFKLPESIDKLPDDKTKGEFTSSLNKLLGAVEKPEDLKDFKFNAGMAEGGKVNEAISGEFSKFIVDNKMPKGLAQKAVEFYNQLGEKFKAQQEAEFLANAQKADETLIALPTIGTKEKLAENDELVRRMFQNNLGLSAEEFEQAAAELVKANFTQNIVLRKALHAAARQLAKEGTHHAGNAPPSPKEKSQYEINKERWPNSPELWGPKE